MTYEIVREIGSQNTETVQRESHLVKVGEPLICRATKTFELYEVDHVVVEALRIFEDGVAYEETHVVASDEDGNLHDSVLYLATRALTVEEAMFSVGEHNYDASIEENPDQDGELADA